jgi:two-component system, sensor histidine kinase
MFRPAFQAAPPERAPIGARPLRILVADDERDAVLMLTLLLRDVGYDVRGVYDSTQVLAVVRVFKPDVVVLDIGRSKMDGYKTARVLRAGHDTEYPVLIAIGGHSKPTDAILAKMGGFDHHFGKPVRPEMLAELLAKITRKATNRTIAASS